MLFTSPNLDLGQGVKIAGLWVDLLSRDSVDLLHRFWSMEFGIISIGKGGGESKKGSVDFREGLLCFGLQGSQDQMAGSQPSK